MDTNQISQNDSDKRENDFIQIPVSLHNFISPHKDAIGTGLYYLSLGDRRGKIEEDSDNEIILPPAPTVKEKTKTIRLKLSPIGQEALEVLIDNGYNKKSAVIAAIEYLKSKPSTILQVAL